MQPSEISSIWKKRDCDVIRAYAIKESLRKQQRVRKLEKG
jgi:hypothetical protein